MKKIVIIIFFIFNLSISEAKEKNCSELDKLSQAYAKCIKDKILVKGSETTEKIKDKSTETADKIKNKSSKTSDKIKESGSKAKDKTKETLKKIGNLLKRKKNND